MNHEQASEFVKKMYDAVWRHLSVEQFDNYYSPSVIGRSGKTVIHFDDIKQHLTRISKQYREIVPDFHRIMAADNLITVWFTQHGIGFDGQEHLCIETMVTYEVKDEKICNLWFIWNVEASVFFHDVNNTAENISAIDKLAKYHLTKREFETLYYLIRHFNSKEIAKILEISHRTVESHIQSIKNKLKVTSVTQIVQFAIAHGYTKPIPELIDLAIKKGLVKPLKS